MIKMFFKNGLNSKLSTKCTILSRRFAGPFGIVGDLPCNCCLVSSGSLKNLRRKCCLCNEICKWLDFLVFSNKDKKPQVLSHSTFNDLFLWDIKEPTPLFEESKGHRPWWCHGQPLWVEGLGRDGTSHGTYESYLCPFPLGRPVSRKTGKEKNPFRACHDI